MQPDIPSASKLGLPKVRSRFLELAERPNAGFIRFLPRSPPAAQIAILQAPCALPAQQLDTLCPCPFLHLGGKHPLEALHLLLLVLSLICELLLENVDISIALVAQRCELAHELSNFLLVLSAHFFEGCLALEGKGFRCSRSLFGIDFGLLCCSLRLAPFLHQLLVLVIDRRGLWYWCGRRRLLLLWSSPRRRWQEQAGRHRRPALRRETRPDQRGGLAAADGRLVRQPGRHRGARAHG